MVKILSNTTLDGSINSLGSYPRYYRDGLPIIRKWRSPLTPFVEQSTTIFTHNLPSFNPLVDAYTVDVSVYCVNATDGYTPGNIVSGLSGKFGVEVTSTQILFHAGNRFEINRKNGNRRPRNMDLEDWEYFINLVAF